jgi:Tfp pilus assembly protein PilE
MSPTEFSISMTAADERFAQALKRDDIREMRAALVEKTRLLEIYFAASRHRAHDEKERARSATPVECGALPPSAANRAVSARRGAYGSGADAR